MLDGALDRVPLDRLRQRELAAAGQALQPDQDVGRAQREQDVVARQADVPRVGAVAVQDGGNPARAPHAAGRALAELAARLGGNAYLGHGNAPQQLPAVIPPRSLAENNRPSACAVRLRRAKRPYSCH